MSLIELTFRTHIENDRRCTVSNQFRELVGRN
jgi:hypothetical protein